MKEQLQRAKQALEAEAPVAAAPAAAESGDAGGGGGAVASKAQQRAKKADDYHARHRDWVAQFNELTGGECAGGDGGVKWAAVRAWQQKHWQLNNLLADGLVGPKTLEAAKLLAKKSAPPKAEKDGAAERGDGKQKEADAPEPGHAEAAEATADKPNLEEADVDEQVTPDVKSSAPQGPAAAKKQTTLAEFESAVAKLEAALAQTKQPQGNGPQKAIAQHYVEGTDDKEAPPALGSMMKTEALRGYNEAAKKLETSWTGLGNAQARAQLLLDAVNEALAAEQVPAILRVSLEDLSNPGKFVANEWLMVMREAVFNATAPKNIGETASQVFHEGRHAEQRFSIARLMATQQPKKSAKEIGSAAGLPEDIARKAVDLRSEPLSAEQQQRTEAFKHDTVDNPAHHAIEESAGAITDAANEAAAVFRAMSPTDQTIASARWQDLRQRAIAGLEAYYELATERDAYAAQKQLAAASK